MSDFLFHKVSEKEKESIKKQAKQIMDDFSNTLRGTSKLSIVGKEIEESLIERKEYDREERKGIECDNSFRKIMFENAKNKDEDFLIAEKKKW